MKLYWRYKKNGKWTWRPAKVGSRIINPVNGQNDWGYFVQEEEE